MSIIAAIRIPANGLRGWHFPILLRAPVLSAAVITCNVLTASADPIVLENNDRWISQVIFSPNGKLLVHASIDGSVIAWNVESKKKVATLRHEHSCFAVAMSPDGKLIATGTTQWIERPGRLDAHSVPAAAAKLWDTESGKELSTITTGHVLTNPAHCASFSPDGKILAFGSCGPRVTDEADKGEVVLWNIEKKRITDIYRPDSGNVYGLAYSPDGKLLAAASSPSGTRAGMVTVWEVSSGKVKLRITNDKCPLVSVCFSPDSKSLAVGGGEYANPFQNLPKVASLSLWDVSKEKEIASFDDMAESVRCVTFSDDGRLLASAGGDQVEESGELILWDVEKRKRLVCVKQSDAALNSVSIAPKGKLLATGASNGKIKIWDVGELLRKSP